jgi:hypothetical protein
MCTTTVVSVPQVSVEPKPRKPRAPKPQVSFDAADEARTQVSPKAASKRKARVSSEAAPEASAQVSSEAAPKTRKPRAAPKPKTQVSSEVAPEAPSQVSSEVVAEAPTQVSPKAAPKRKAQVSPKAAHKPKAQVSPEAAAAVAPTQVSVEPKAAPKPRKPKTPKSQVSPEAAEEAWNNLSATGKESLENVYILEFLKHNPNKINRLRQQAGILAYNAVKDALKKLNSMEQCFLKVITKKVSDIARQKVKPSTNAKPDSDSITSSPSGDSGHGELGDLCVTGDWADSVSDSDSDDSEN